MVREPYGIRFDEWHRQAELDLEACGLEWTDLRPSYFMQNLLIQGASGRLALPFADRPVNLVDVRDIAGVAVAALTRSRPRRADLRHHRAGSAEI